MSETQLRDDLERLRAHIDQLAAGDGQARAKLDRLIADIESRLEHPEDQEHHHTLMERVKDAIGDFETGHPRATAILNDIMVTLGNMGI